MNTREITAAIQCILTAAQSLGSLDYYEKSRMTILGLTGELFCENEQAQTKLIIVCSEENTYLELREAWGGLKARVGNRVTSRLSLYPHSLLFFSVSFNQSLVFPSRQNSKACQHILYIVGLSQAEV